VARTPADEPIVAVVAVVDMEADNLTVRQARIALTGVWPKSVRLAEAASYLVGRSLDESSRQAVAEGVEKEIAPKGDFLGSEEYRQAMAGVLTHRTLEQCLRQEESGE
jgi:CO/xanthine dehydrogenase FAD-binding subunit